MKMCAFPDCPNPKSDKAGGGLCSSHYWQKHKGRELTPLAYRKNVLMPWLLEHVSHDSDDCLTWPFSRNPSDGRAGVVQFNGGNVPATRVMCELAHGKPPTPEHQAAHSCGMGHEACVNPKHLRWATSVENHADMIGHGTRQWGERHYASILTEARVRAIREFAHTLKPRVIADLFGLKHKHVEKVIARTIWRHV